MPLRNLEERLHEQTSLPQCIARNRNDNHEKRTTYYCCFILQCDGRYACTHCWHREDDDTVVLLNKNGRAQN